MARREPTTADELKLSRQFRDKVKEYQVLTNKKYQDISKELDMGYTYFSSMVNGKALVSDLLIQKLEACIRNAQSQNVPKSSYSFIPYPQGTLFGDCNTDKPQVSEPSNLSQSISAHYEKIIREKDAIISDLRYIIDHMKQIR